MERNGIYTLTADYDVEQLWDALREQYKLEHVGEEEIELFCMDSFDWRLYQKNLFVCRKRARYILEDGVGCEQQTATGSRKKHPFWWDIEESDIQTRLKSVLDVRALSEQFRIKRIKNSYLLLNKDQKTVLRFSRVRNFISRAGVSDEPHQLDQVIFLDPLRGYEKPVKGFSGLLLQNGAVGWTGQGSYVDEGFKLYGIDPDKTSSKFEILLPAEGTINEAVSSICLQLQATMALNVEGVNEDIDSEYLHDFRVAMRRTRSLLILVKKYLPSEEIAFFTDELKWLGAVTGPTRDLDVYHLAKDDFKLMLPTILHAGVDSFFDELTGKRKRTLRNLRKSLGSERFALFMQKWEVYLKKLAVREDLPAGRKSCKKSAAKIIRKRFEKILTHGHGITPVSPDEELHNLRIEAKKFRYLLEFFKSLFNDASVDTYLKQLKRLQNNLGDFNDLSVQIEVLGDYMGEIRPGDSQGVETGAALGGLIVHLMDEKDRVRKKFEKTFRTFSSDENVELLESIFTEKKRRSEQKGGGE